MLKIYAKSFQGKLHILFNLNKYIQQEYDWGQMTQNKIILHV